MKPRTPVFAIALLSMATLAHEILLMRLFSIIQWHHFAYMIISLALLGYGASGTAVTLLQRPLLRHFPVAFPAAIALFAITATTTFLIVQQLPFNAEELLWDSRQPLWLLVIYLILAIPFFFAASAIALALMRFSDQVGRLYAFDLFGAGLGGLLVIALLFLLLPMSALAAIGLIAAVAAVVAAMELRERRSWITLALLLPLPALAWLSATTPLNISSYKGLSQTMQIMGTELVETRNSPLGLLDVVESHQIPFRDAPGLSLMASSEPPPQVAVFTDGDNMTTITEDRGDPARFTYLDEMPSALPYHLNSIQTALILGAGGGSIVLQAHYHDVGQIDAVELNPQLADLVRGRYGEFSGHLYDRPGIRLFIDEARGFVGTSEQHYDLLQLALIDAFAASSAGLHALNENYLYTVEALQDYLAHVTAKGYLSISRWVRLPPRDNLKLLATAIEALRRAGVANPGEHLAMIRSWQIATLLIKNSPFETSEIERLKKFSKARAFDLVWYPGMVEAEANQYNHLDRPWFHQGARALLSGNADQFLANYKFNLDPASDDRPYFFHFFKWRSLDEIMSLRHSGGMALLEQSYLILVATLVQAIIASAVLILLPLVFLRRTRGNGDSTVKPSRVWVYFFAIGLAFLFIEMSYIQKFILLLHHPVYSVATVMTGFLVFAGAGSLYSQRLAERNQMKHATVYAVIAIIVFGAGLPVLLQIAQPFLLTLSLELKTLATLAVIAPLAFFMGMPFPLAMASLGKTSPQFIPWAWGINGCASVISAVSATLLAMHGGFSLVIALALLLYGIAAFSFPTAKDTDRTVEPVT